MSQSFYKFSIATEKPAGILSIAEAQYGRGECLSFPSVDSCLCMAALCDDGLITGVHLVAVTLTCPVTSTCPVNKRAADFALHYLLQEKCKEIVFFGDISTWMSLRSAGEFESAHDYLKKGLGTKLGNPEELQSKLSTKDLRGTLLATKGEDGRLKIGQQGV